MSLFGRLFGRRRNGEAPEMTPELAEQTVKSDATLRASDATLVRVNKILDHDGFLAAAEVAEADRRARRTHAP